MQAVSMMAWRAVKPGSLLSVVHSGPGVGGRPPGPAPLGGHACAGAVVGGGVLAGGRAHHRAAGQVADLLPQAGYTNPGGSVVTYHPLLCHLG
jgi:hypothetical protein